MAPVDMTVLSGSETAIFRTKTVIFPTKTVVFIRKTVVFTTKTVFIPRQTGVTIAKTVAFVTKPGVSHKQTVVFPVKTGVFFAKPVVFPANSVVFLTETVAFPAETDICAPATAFIPCPTDEISMPQTDIHAPAAIPGIPAIRCVSGENGVHRQTGACLRIHLSIAFVTPDGDLFSKKAGVHMAADDAPPGRYSNGAGGRWTKFAAKFSAPAGLSGVQRKKLPKAICSQPPMILTLAAAVPFATTAAIFAGESPAPESAAAPFPPGTR